MNGLCLTSYGGMTTGMEGIGIAMAQLLRYVMVRPIASIALSSRLRALKDA